LQSVRTHSDDIIETAIAVGERAAKAAETARSAPVVVRMRGPRVSPEVRKLSKRFHLHLISPNQLKITRKRAGDGFVFHGANGRKLTNEKTVARLNSLAVPPAYEDVHYAADPRAHIQAIGRDAAGRLQYRYHPDWEKVREARKAEHVGDLIQVLPKIRRSVAQHLSGGEPTKAFALAAVIELVGTAFIRAGSEEYAKEHGTRGAATLLKSNVKTEGGRVTLHFRAKGNNTVEKEFESARLCSAIETLRALPGKRLFQYRDESGEVHVVRARDVNVFLREIAGCAISLKDFRTLCASAAVLETLARAAPAGAQRGRRKQVLEAVRSAAEELANTPAICRKSYVHDAVVTAFEDGVLERFAATLKSCRSAAKREQFLAQVLATAA
jgi:DNA topoisomerase-1